MFRKFLASLFLALLTLLPTVPVQAMSLTQIIDDLVFEDDDPYQNVDPSTLRPHRIRVNGTMRTFYVHLPSYYNRRSPMPLVLLFHGGGGNALAIANKTHMDDTSENNGFISVYPESINNHWNDGRPSPHRGDYDDVGFIKALIPRLEQHINIDQSRIYIAGFSDGGWFTQRLTYEMNSTIAGAAMVASLETTALISLYGQGHKPLPVLFMLGTSDPRMHWNGGAVANGAVISADATVNSWVLANGCNQQPSIQALPNTHPHDNSTVELDYYAGPSGNDVAFYKIIGGGHSWPGGIKSPPSEGNTNEDINGTRDIWNFFAAHHK